MCVWYHWFQSYIIHNHTQSHTHKYLFLSYHNQLKQHLLLCFSSFFKLFFCSYLFFQQLADKHKHLFSLPWITFIIRENGQDNRGTKSPVGHILKHHVISRIENHIQHVNITVLTQSLTVSKGFNCGITHVFCNVRKLNNWTAHCEHPCIGPPSKVYTLSYSPPNASPFFDLQNTHTKRSYTHNLI